MKTLLKILFALSLLANGWLLIKSHSDRSEAAPTTAPVRMASASVAEGTGATMAAADDERAATLAGANLFIEALRASDLAAFRDKLRAAGIDERSIRDTIEGALRARYFVRIKAWRLEQNTNHWWFGPRGPISGDSIPSQQALIAEPLRTLLGPGELDIADAEVRYAFLPPEKRRLLALVDLDYTELLEKIRPANLSYNPVKAVLKSDADQMQYLNRERQKDILAALTQEERAEYELRFSSAAAGNTVRFATMNATEQEFRTIAPVLETLRQAQSAVPAGPGAPAARANLEQGALDQLVATIGYDRAVDYAWSIGMPLYTETVSFLREANLPPTQAPRILQLAAETGARAMEIHYDPALTVEQKKNALGALHDSVQPQLDALIPTGVSSKLPDRAFSWFTGLSDGRYQIVQSTMGNAAIGPMAGSIAGPPPGPRRVLPLPRRSAN